MQEVGAALVQGGLQAWRRSGAGEFFPVPLTECGDDDIGSSQRRFEVHCFGAMAGSKPLRMNLVFDSKPSLPRTGKQAEAPPDVPRVVRRSLATPAPC